MALARKTYKLFSIITLLVLAGVLVGCKSKGLSPDDAPDKVIAARWVEEPLNAGAMRTERLAASSLDQLLQHRFKNPPADAKPKNILVLSAGGKYAAFMAGQLVGWTEHGTRPKFDIATGISSGAMVASFAFLGEKYDAAMTKFFTSIEQNDLFDTRPLYYFIKQKSIADPHPLRGLIRQVLNDEYLADLTAAYHEGRRLYVATLNLRTRRLTIWDLTSIAATNPCPKPLIENILVAAASIPGLCPEVKFPVTVDGVPYVEHHIDGGAASQAFVRFPTFYASFGADGEPRLDGLVGSNMYVFSAGKLYADAISTDAGLFAKIVATTSTSLYALYRADLYRLYAKCIAGGMRFCMTAIPDDFEVSPGSMKIKKGEFRKLFMGGYTMAKAGIKWRALPPGSEPNEEEMPRQGLQFRTVTGEDIVFEK